MTNNIDLKEALQFYIDNDLNEVISDNAQDHFAQKESVKKITKLSLDNPEENLKKPKENLQIAQQNFIKPQFSTNQAISTLAKKSQQNTDNNDQKFVALNDIIAKAKTAASAAQTLDELRSVVENFEGCNLKKMATNTVFAQGNANSEIMIIGEAPGNHEDLQGVPFCGDSGKVLNEMFGAINMSRDKNIYITNVIFWRPPGNRRPTSEELAICRPFVERHIQILDPKIIVLVGSTAMTAVLGISDAISKVRGQFLDFAPDFLDKKIKSFTIFHPSYLMRQPAKKKIAWQDMLALENFLNKE